jgi:hypothetical protein
VVRLTATRSFYCGGSISLSRAVVVFAAREVDTPNKKMNSLVRFFLSRVTEQTKKVASSHKERNSK